MNFTSGERWLIRWEVWLAIFLPTLIMLPVLIWPHYGLFSDAGQAINAPKAFIEEFPRSIFDMRPLEDGRWNPLFHGLTFFIYFMVPDSARALYAAQWIMFSASSVSIAWLLVRLTGSRWIAAFGSVLFCTASSVFENFYTLDKVEPRVTLFSALIVLSLGIRFLTDRGHGGVKPWLGFIFGQAVLGVWLVFSKETGVYIAAALGASWLASVLNPQWGQAVRVLFRNTAVIHIVVVLIFVALFKMLSSDMSYRYVSYQVTSTMVAMNVAYYVLSSPELALGLLAALYWSVSTVWRRLAVGAVGVHPVLVFLSISQLTYFAGIILWRWPLDYYLLPAHLMSALLVPLTAWLLWQGATTMRPLLRVVRCLAVVAWCGFLGFRAFVGGAIYAQDALKDELAAHLSSPEWFGERIVLPFTHPDSAEVGERLKFFINRIRPEEHSVEMYNFWEPPFLNRENLERFDGSAGIAPDRRQLAEAAEHPERYVMWQFGTREPGIFSIPIGFQASYLRKGDLILLPTTSHELHWVRARGISMYQSAEDFVQRTPLQLSRVGGVSRQVAHATIGWDIFRVEDTLEEAQTGVVYPLALLMTLNDKTDIIPFVSSETLFAEHRFPDNGVLIGRGWYGVERHGGTFFRWMGASSEIVLTMLPAGICTISIDVEPLLLPGSEPFSLRITKGSDQAAFPLQGRDTVVFNFRSTGESQQILRLNTSGGATSAPKGDQRLLKVRAFGLSFLKCDASKQ